MPLEQYEIKAVLFDLDGVLVDAREWHYEALNKALGLFGYAISRDEHDGVYNGLPTRKKLVRLSEERALPAALHDFISEMKQAYTMHYIHNHAKPSFDKQIMLKRLRQNGLKLGVCSNAIRVSVEMMLEKALIKDYFDLILSNQDVDNNKPHPEIYLKAMELLEVKPEETIIVEDNPHGVEAARGSGAKVIVVPDAASVSLSIFKDHINI